MTRDQKKRKTKKPVAVAAESVAPGAEPSLDGPKHVRRTRRKRRAEVNMQLLQELAALRNSVDEMVERYAIRVNGQISELMQLIQGDGEVGEAPNMLTLKTAQAMRDALNDVQLKPGKGRGKDFVRIQRLVSRLRTISPIES
jgi:hypothetical protein